METILNITIERLETMTIEEYFNFFESNISKSIDVEYLTNLLSGNSFTETKPYFYRRALIPTDNRFKKIELVFDDEKNLRAIVWDLELSLSWFVRCFGNYQLVNEPYSNSTAFVFSSSNAEVEYIKTRYPGWLAKTDEKDSLEFFEDHTQKVVTDPILSFLQIDLQE